MHKTTRWTALGVVALALAGTSYASAQQKTGKSDTSKTTTGASDASCPTTPDAKLAAALSFMHGDNQNEIQMSKMAVDRVQSPAVKQFAQRMVDDHKAADDKLTALAKKKGISLSTTNPCDPIHAAAAKLDDAYGPLMKGKSGTAFEAAYMAPEAIKHTLGLQIVEQAQGVAKDNDVKTFLDNVHKTLSQHRDMAMKIQDTMKVGSPQGIGGGPQSGDQGGSMQQGGTQGGMQGGMNQGSGSTQGGSSK